MATHSSILAWRSPWTKEPGRLQSMRCKESNMTEQLSIERLKVTAENRSGFPTEKKKKIVILPWFKGLNLAVD